MNNIAYLISKAWKIDKRIFIYLFVFTIISALLPFIDIFTPKIIIDELMIGKRINVLVGLIVAIFLIASTLTYLNERLGNLIFPRMLKVRMNLNLMLEKKWMEIDLKYTEDKDVINKFHAATASVENEDNGIGGVYQRLFGILGKIIAFMGYATIAFMLNPLILIYLITNVIVVYFLTIRIKKFEYSMKEKRAECNRKCNYIYKTMSDFSVGKDIRIFNMKNWLSNKYTDFSKEGITVFKKIKYKQLSVNIVDVILFIAREGIIYSYLIYSVIFDGMSIGNFTMYFLAIGGFANWMENIIKDIAHIKAQNMYITDFRCFLEIGNNESKEETIEIPKDKPYEIEFKNVTFKYPNSDRYIYKNISLKIKGGQKLAIVGINGAGKTTFIKLLTRLYEPTEGEILLNGININKLNKEEYFKIFSPVFQEIKMMAFSIKENIALMPKSKIDEKKVLESIERADMKEKIDSLERGIDTSLLKILDDKGIELSGGQNQKLALARALYKNGDIVILDEPTAALDPIAEYNTYLRFNDLVGDKTAIYVSHRLASTRFCDVIAFFENGEIKEYGTHEELLNKVGRYREMFDIQARYYKEDLVEEVV